MPKKYTQNMNRKQKQKQMNLTLNRSYVVSILIIEVLRCLLITFHYIKIHASFFGIIKQLFTKLTQLVVRNRLNPQPQSTKRLPQVSLQNNQILIFKQFPYFLKSFRISISAKSGECLPGSQSPDGHQGGIKPFRRSTTSK